MTRGNLTTGSCGYDIWNNLTAGPSSATLAYDPALRLYQTVGSGVTTRFLYDGAQAIAEYNGSNQLQRRFIPGPSLDEPIVWYEGSGTTDRRWLIADERGSVIAVTNASGAASTINTYDEYGIPAGTNAGRFQYTGQMWLPEVARYHYRARAYAPTTGRFQQSDPILYAGGINLYAYVGNDPVNLADPFGLTCLGGQTGEDQAFTGWTCDGGLAEQRLTLETRLGPLGPLGPLERGGDIDPLEPLPPIDRLPYPRRGVCEDLQQSFRDEQLRAALAAQGGFNIGAWYTGVAIGVGRFFSPRLAEGAAASTAVVPETALYLSGAHNYADIYSQSLVWQGEIRAEMRSSGCFD